MLRSEVLDLVNGIGGKIKKEEVESAVDNYYQTQLGADDEARKNDCSEMVKKYYNLVTKIFEYGWGESFHFAPRWKEETFKESIKRYEHFIALQLGLKRGMKVLDVGCGIGGPMREIARFSLASITGLNNNEYQIDRAIVLNGLVGLNKSCNFVTADFMKMPFPDNTFDAIYCIESICHGHDVLGCYKEIYRVLKPGQCFGTYEWCLTENYNPNSENHNKIKADIVIGSGLPDLRTTLQCHEALKQAGFEIIWEKDLAVDSPLPWYLPLDTSFFSLTGFRSTDVGRLLTMMMVKTLEFVHIAPPGSSKTLSLLEKAVAGLVEGGRKEIFTPMYLFLVRKPLSES